MQDDQIIALYFQRNESAIYETSDKYGAYCAKIANSILNDPEDTEECVSDVWLRTWNAIPPQRPGRLRPFLAKITRNLAFNRYKARSAEKRGGGAMELVLDELAECLPAEETVEQVLEGRELEELIRRFLKGCSPRDRDVFLRRYFFVESVQEIARRYRLRESNVLVILSRTRQKLKDFLNKEGYAP